MAVEAGTGRDEVNLADTRVHEMKKEADVESDACDKDKLQNNKRCKRSGSSEELVRIMYVCEPYHQNKNKT